ncbi:hypothetical protein [Nocardia arthritidis]|uniref:DUF1345 domain-containing protein n=1 Tax=Nocardia arthritidis TaxID=228602 RepID=A0A6G9Y6H8_9NOCA|nr:hypothetical protein [Nocardia arthritidis]QIS08676.1 hypothetical protein F5544_03810 [Nocardia arthritidis]
MTSADDDVPAWQRKTAGESRIVATLAVVCMVALPREFRMDPWWPLPTLELLLLIVLFAANPVRINHESNLLRALGLVLTGLLGLANVWSAALLVDGLLTGVLSNQPAKLLGSGGSIWITNVLVFALLYWEFDRGGPAARAHARKLLPDFLFAQMQNPDLTRPDWEPEFTDYLYLAFTNATAFSPTDVMPMSRWAKLSMMLQSATSLVLAALVIARAINVLK